MTKLEIYKKTLFFSWVKLGLYLLNTLVSILLLGIVFGLCYLIGGGFVFIPGFLIWIALAITCNRLIMKVIGYTIKAGHIAVITQAMQTGSIPECSIAKTKETITENFATTATFFLIDSLITGAIRQIQRTVGKIGDFLNFIPGLNIFMFFLQKFIDISLGYIDECCLGYIFLHKEKNSFQAAADGVVVFFQNWKILLKNAARITGIVVLSRFVLTLILFMVIGILFNIINIPSTVTLILAYLIAKAISQAFIDAYILIDTMTEYMKQAETTELSYDLYEKISNLSSKFKDLLSKGQNEVTSPTA